MFKLNKKKVSMLAAAMMVVVAFTGCQDAAEEEAAAEDTNPPVEETVEETEEVEVAEDEVELSEWEGSWNNMAAYLDDEELEVAFEELAERDGVSVEEARAAYLEDRVINFDGLIVEGNKAIFLNGFEDDGGETIEEMEYEYLEMLVAKHGNFDTEWYAFEAKEESDYPYLLLMPVHGEEALTHFHFRYGESLDEILELEDWYPTFVRPESTYDQIYEEVTE